MNRTQIVVAVGVALKILDVGFAVLAQNYPAVKFFTVTAGLLADLVPQLSAPQARMAIKKAAPLAVLFVMLGVNACASVNWTTPVLYGGPAVAPIEEVSAKNPVPAAAAGFQETVGLGQFPFAGKEWDALDLSLLELGGLVVPGSGPVGALQLGAEIGTLNGIVGLGILANVVTADNTGLFQNGTNAGPVFAGMLNVQALVAYLGQPATADKAFTPRLPRGGL